MNKTKLGISKGLLSSMAFLAAIISNTMALIIMGYVLIVEEDKDLRSNTVQAFLLSIGILILSALISDLIFISFISINLVRILGVLRLVLLVGLAYKVRNGENANIPFISNVTV